MPRTIDFDHESTHLLVTVANSGSATQTMDTLTSSGGTLREGTHPTSTDIGMLHTQNADAEHQNALPGTGAMSLERTHTDTTDDRHARTHIPLPFDPTYLSDVTNADWALHVQPGTTSYPVWNDIPQIEWRDVDRNHTHFLEPFRGNGGDILDPVRINAPQVGQGYATGAHAYLLESMSPIHNHGSSIDYDWAVALKTYDYLRPEEATHSVDLQTQWSKESELTIAWSQRRQAAEEVEDPFLEDPIILQNRCPDATPWLLLSLEENSNSDNEGAPSSRHLRGFAALSQDNVDE
ncbi:uncharacterized protein B0H18DRAFT_952215 [Fomitopsis serialis]|uniref:uncharacterized protein n=1 Tax=Fomitopsis serialis TaxID=139415 RepID=UPI00200792CF|nr:uncharacterized protein B0H18DRAFT_952215 [Neoantrodia serialis]KAH9932468.1 hypothetical protein B0H18DRAFT_952215 [Neoantrodia serialis]